MPNSASFDQTLYNLLKNNIAIHKLLLETNDKNVQQTADAILKMKQIITTKEGILLLCRCFIDVVSSNPKNVAHLIELFIVLQNIKSTDEANLLNLLSIYIIKCIHTREKLKMSSLYFLRQLLLRKSISYNSIINEFNNLPPQFQSSNTKLELINDDPSFSLNNDNLDFEENENMQGQLIDLLTPFTQANNKKYQILMMFHPEINEKKSINMNHILNVPKRLIFKPELFQQSFTKTDPISEMIRNDDIEAFQRYISQSTDMSFKNNKIQNHESFELFSILSHEPSLIQYSAFFNSLKIFKYLLLNKAETKDINNGIFSIVDFAVAGGSVEIIHILEQNHFKMVSGIPTAIRFYQNGILSYLLDNFFPKSDEDFELMDIGKFRKKEKNDFVNVFKNNDSASFKFNLNNENDYDYFYNDHDPFKLEYKVDEINEVEKTDDRFKYFNYDAAFRAIVESNNLLALFTLFDYGMKINACDKQSKRTLLHWSVQKGKTFLCKLLLSNKYIDTSLLDEYGESAVVYSVKFGKLEIFYEFMKNEKVKSSLKTNDILLMANYAWMNGLQKVTDYLFENFKFDLVEMIKSGDTEKFTKIVNYIPIVYLFNQIKPVLTETFLNDNLVLFAVLANRMTLEDSLKFSGDFYYNSSDNKEVDYVGILNSYYYSDLERYRFQNIYQGSDYVLPNDYGSHTKFERISSFKFHKIDKNQKLHAELTLKHPLINKYMK